MENLEQIFYKIFENVPRQGPGNFQSTQKALSLLTNLPEQANILDIGCGSGAQTITLAQLTNAQITAVDNHQPFLEILKHRAIASGLSTQIDCVLGDMFALNFEANSFDLIWSEGSIYLIGLAQGLQIWKKYLRPPGYLVFSHISWLKDNPPEEIYQFWQQEYPAINNITKNLQIIANNGYHLIEYFPLSEAAWWEYYLPLEKQLQELKTEYKDNSKIQNFLNIQLQEIDLYRQYSAYYGYVFYLLNKGD